MSDQETRTEERAESARTRQSQKLLKSKKAKKAWVGFMVVTTIALFATLIYVVKLGASAENKVVKIVEKVDDPLKIEMDKADAIRKDAELILMNLEKSYKSPDRDDATLLADAEKCQAMIEEAMGILEKANAEFDKRHPGQTNSELADGLQGTSKQFLRLRYVLRELK